MWNWKRSHRTLLIVLWLALSSLSVAAAHIDPAVTDAIGGLSSRIDSILRKNDIPGAGVALITADSILWIGGVGTANLDTKEAFTEETRFQVASVSKTLVALGVLKLVEEKRLDLNQPVKDICPDVALDNPWDKTDPVRIIHLLEHTSGIDNTHFNESYNLSQDPNPRLADVLAINPQSKSVRWRPGTRMSYSNDGYALVGYVLEKVTGKRFEDFMKEEVLDPLGMVNSTFWYESSPPAHAATGYLSNRTPLPFVPLYMKPASSLVTTLRDLTILVRLMLNRGSVDGRFFISPESIDRMEVPTTSLAAREGLQLGYGIGIRPKFVNGYKYFGHGGGIPGYQCQFSYFKDLGVGCVVMVNSSEPGFWSVFQEVVDVLLSNQRELRADGMKLSPEALEKFDGYYQYNSSETFLDAQLNTLLAGMTITHQDSTLYYSELGGEPRALVAVSENTFRRESEPEATMMFFTNDQGEFVLADPVNNAEYYRTGGWKPLVYRGSLLLAAALLASYVMFSLVWVPVYIYKRARRIASQTTYFPMRVFPLLSIIALLICLIALNVCLKDVVGIGHISPSAVIFFLSGILFALLSAVSLATALASFRHRVAATARIYVLTVSCACVGMSIYLWYWDIIGLRLWAY